MGHILITGIAGGLAQRVAEVLVERGQKVVGVDYRPVGKLGGLLSRVEIHRAKYDKTAIEDVFRAYSGAGIDAVLHLGRVGNLREEMGKRFDLNVTGSQKLLELALRYRVRAMVVLSTFHVYGADARNHTPIGEDDPLRAGTEFPEIADAIQLDSMAALWAFRYRDVRTVVLRPTNVVGPTVNNTMSKFLRLPVIPHLLGYNPMTQFVHERDLAAAIVLALDGPRGGHEGRGVFNVAGPTAIPWRTAIELVDARALALLPALASIYGRLAGFPHYLLNFYKWPCVIGDANFRRAFGYKPTVDIRTSLYSTVAEARAVQRGSWMAAR
ncbi:MAG: NAD-dependent epimerase/dehydratase family protein [Myxococcales bacterium]|nr:NAD-dependent epimerase/dehydratase family protein [Myxococcales bacterium]MBL8715943.1 NAD-dependent epimerase/dehydratase family protein [Myxococcales bacterium]